MRLQKSSLNWGMSNTSLYSKAKYLTVTIKVAGFELELSL